MKPYLLFPLLLAQPVFADGHGTLNFGEGAAVEAWQGDSVHLMMTGMMNGNDVAIYADDTTAVTLEGRRTYTEGGDWLQYTAFDLTLVADGVTPITVAIQSTDFTAHFLPVDLPIAPDASEDDVAMTLTIGDAAPVAGWVGNLSFELDDQADYPAEDGNVGGYLTATRGDDSIAMSFTIPMVAAIVE